MHNGAVGEGLSDSGAADPGVVGPRAAGPGVANPSVSVPDRRPGDRCLRVTWHPDRSTVVFSHWVEGLCVASTQVSLHDAEAVLAFLASSLPIEAAPASSD